MPRAALSASLFYAALTLWFLWPLPTALSTHLLYPENPWKLVEADADFVLWAMSWTAHALAHDPLGLFDANIFYPMPRALALSDHMVGHQQVFAPVFLLSGNPVLAGNVLALAHHWLAAMGAFLLAARFLPAAPALVAGAAYSFLVSRRAGLVHLHVLAVGWMPLALFFADRWLERARPRDGAAMALALALELLSSFYLAYMMAIGWLCALPVLLWRWRDRLDRRRLLGGLAWCLVAALPFLALSLPYLELQREGFLPSYDVDGAHVGGLVPGFAEVAATRVLRQGVGPLGLALALLGLAPPWRRPRALLGLALMLVLAGWLVGRGPANLALGPLRFASPYRWLLAWVPGFASVRVPDRMLNVTALGVALLAGLGAARLLRPAAARPRLAWPVAAALAAAVVALPWEWPDVALHRRDVGEHAPASARWLARHGDGRPLLELPPKTFRPAAARMLASTAHWLPLLDGYTSHPPPVRDYLAARTADLPEPGALAALLRDTDVGWILVHGDELAPPARRRWQSTALPPELEHVATFGADSLFRVRAHGPTRPGSPLYDRTRTPGGAPREPLGERCPGRLAIVARRPTEPLGDGSVFAAGSVLRFTIRIANDGDRPWPGGGLHPYRQVRLRVCIASPREGDSPCPGRSALLLADVPAHGTLELDWLEVAPRTPASYVLWADLFQIDGGSLARCGVAPVAVPITVRAPEDGVRRALAG